jgi:hypothetical protein
MALVSSVFSGVIAVLMARAAMAANGPPEPRE